MRVPSSQSSFVCNFLTRYPLYTRIARGITVVAIAAIATLSIAGSAIGQERFPLVGVWRHTEPATQSSPGNSTTLVFKPDGTFTSEQMVAPQPGLVGTIIQYWGRYRPTSATSFIYQVEYYKACASGGSCMSCPGDQQVCAVARYAQADPGVQHQATFQMRGPNEHVDRFGQAWLRIR